MRSVTQLCIEPSFLTRLLCKALRELCIRNFDDLSGPTTVR